MSKHHRHHAGVSARCTPTHAGRRNMRLKLLSCVPSLYRALTKARFCAALRTSNAWLSGSFIAQVGFKRLSPFRTVPGSNGCGDKLLGISVGVFCCSGNIVHTFTRCVHAPAARGSSTSRFSEGQTENRGFPCGTSWECRCSRGS